MNGYEAARRLRQEYGHKRMTLIALTGWGQEEDKRKAIEAGFDHHLVKTGEPRDLQRLLAAKPPHARVGIQGTNEQEVDGSPPCTAEFH